MERYVLNEEQWEEFNRLLEAPERETPKLDARMKSTPMWAEEEEEE